MGITPHHRSYSPIRHPLAVNPLPGFAGYRVYPSPEISLRGKTGFSSCLACPCQHAVATTPSKLLNRIIQSFDSTCCLRPTVGGSAFEFIHLRGHLCVHFRYGLFAHPLPKGEVVDRLQDFGLPPPCYPSYEASDSYPGRSCLLLNTPAFAGRTTGRESFPSSGSSLHKGTFQHPAS